jgi:hypothetical protein
METKKWKNFRTGQILDIPAKSDPEALIDQIEEYEKETGKEWPGGMDAYGREIIDPRPMVVESKPLTMEQKILNQFIIANNKAMIERENLPWDMSTPEAVQNTLREVLDLDMPEDEAEFISAYTVLPMAQDYPSMPEGPGPQVGSKGDPPADPTPEPEPDPAPQQ